MYEDLIKEIQDEINFVKGNASPEFITGMERAIELIRMRI